MSVATTVIVEGQPVKVSSRTFTAKTTGKEMTFTSVLVVGEFCISNVEINLDTFKLPELGKPVRMQVEVGTYRDDDTVRLVAYI